MTNTILTIYRNDIPVLQAHWTARYVTTEHGLRYTLEKLSKYVGTEYTWFVTTFTA